MFTDKKQNLEIYEAIVVERIERDAKKTIETCSQFSPFLSLNKKKLICFDLYSQFVLEQGRGYDYNKIAQIFKKDDPDGFNWNDLEKFVNTEIEKIVQQYSEQIRNFFIQKFNEDLIINKDLQRKWMLLEVQREM
jgi:predicted nucleic acid-binding OB-fold protein